MLSPVFDNSVRNLFNSNSVKNRVHSPCFGQFESRSARTILLAAMRKETYDTIVTCHKKLLLVDIDPDSLNDDQISEISRLSQEISQRAIQLRECAQTLHRNAKNELEALQKVVVEFLTTGKYNKKSFGGMIGLLVSGSRSVSNDRIKRIKALNGLRLVFVLLGMEMRGLGKMRQSPFNAVMSLISDTTIDEKIPAYARELDEFLREPGKSYLEIKSEIEKYAADRHNDPDLAIIAVDTFNLKRKRGKEDTEISQGETEQPEGFLEAAFSIRKDEYLRVIGEYGGDGLLGFSSNTETNATILVPISRKEAKLLPKSLRLPPARSSASPSTQPGPIFFARTCQSSVS